MDDKYDIELTRSEGKNEPTVTLLILLFAFSFLLLVSSLPHYRCRRRRRCCSYRYCYSIVIVISSNFEFDVVSIVASIRCMKRRVINCNCSKLMIVNVKLHWEINLLTNGISRSQNDGGGG